MSEEQNEMSFLNHLEVLRWTLIRSTLAIFVFGLVAFMMKDFIFNVIILAPKDPSFVTYRFLCSVSQLLGTNGLCMKFPLLCKVERWPVNFQHIFGLLFSLVLFLPFHTSFMRYGNF